MGRQYLANEDYDVVTKYYAGTDTLREGYAMCYLNTATTTDADPKLRAGAQVTKPATANLMFFAGLVAPDSDGVAGPGYISLIVPRKGQIVRAAVINTAGALVAGTTGVGPVDASYALQLKADATLNLALVGVAFEAYNTAAIAVKAIQFK